MKPYYALYAAIMLVAFSPQAQERAAGSTLETQMTWSALSSKIGQVDGKIGGVKSLVDQSIVCGKKGMVYAPGGSGIDGQGCKTASVDLTTINNNITNLTNTVNNQNSTFTTINTNVSNILQCGAAGMVYSTTDKGCIATPAKKEILTSAGWVRGSYKVSCTQGRTVLMAKGNATTNSNQTPCSLAGNCDHDRMDCFDKPYCDWNADGRNYYSMFVVCN